MAESPDIAQFIIDIADRVRHHAHARAASDGDAQLGPPEPVPVATARVDPASIRSHADLAPYIDHTLLKPEATREDVLRVAQEARTHGFATVCVNSSHVADVARVLEGSRTVPIAVVGFPLGAALASAKAFEAREAVRAGAREIDMVLNVGALKSRDYARVHEDIAAVVEASHPYPVKVILETGLLDTEQKLIACVLA